MAGFIGKAVVIKVNTGTEQAPVWTAVAGQQGGTLNRSTDTVEATTKDSDNKEYVAGHSEWSFELDGIYQIGDTGFNKLDSAYSSKVPVKVQIAIPSEAGKFDIHSGMAIITDLPLEFNSDDFATYSCTLQGTGALTKTTGSVGA